MWLGASPGGETGNVTQLSHSRKDTPQLPAEPQGLQQQMHVHILGQCTGPDQSRIRLIPTPHLCQGIPEASVPAHMCQVAIPWEGMALVAQPSAPSCPYGYQLLCWRCFHCPIPWHPQIPGILDIYGLRFSEEEGGPACSRHRNAGNEWK